MGMNLYITLEKEIGGADPNERDRVWTCQMLEMLDAIANGEGVRPLSCFLSYDEVELDEEFLTGASLPKTQWFEPSELLPTIRRLCGSIETDTRPFDRTQLKDRVPELLAELQDVKAVAERAAAASSRLRLWIGE